MSGVLDLDRAGFRSRSVAYLIDAALAYLLFHLIAALAFSATGGALFSTSGLQTSACRPEAAMPAGGPAVMDMSLQVPVKTPPPAPLPPEQTYRCDVSFLGLPAGRYVGTASLVATGKEMRMGMRVVALDPTGRPRPASALDIWLVPFFVWLRATMDGIDASPGRRLVRIKLVDGRDADDRAPPPPPLPRLAARYALFALPALPALLFAPDLSTAWLVPSPGAILALFGQIVLVSLPGVIAAAAAMLAIARDRYAFYDRPAATQVRRLR